MNGASAELVPPLSLALSFSPSLSPLPCLAEEEEEIKPDNLSMCHPIIGEHSHFATLGRKHFTKLSGSKFDTSPTVRQNTKLYVIHIRFGIKSMTGFLSNTKIKVLHLLVVLGKISILFPFEFNKLLSEVLSFPKIVLFHTVNKQNLLKM